MIIATNLDSIGFYSYHERHVIAKEKKQTHLRNHCVQIVIKLIHGRTNIALSTILETRTACAAEYLQNVKNRQVYEGSFGTVIYLCSLDDD